MVAVVLMVLPIERQGAALFVENTELGRDADDFRQKGMENHLRERPFHLPEKFGKLQGFPLGKSHSLPLSLVRTAFGANANRAIGTIAMESYYVKGSTNPVVTRAAPETS